MMNKIELKLIEAYTTLLMAERISLESIPEHLREQVEIEKAERTIDILKEGI